jgi:uncharacterized protein YidB (DUF937 family)
MEAKMGLLDNLFGSGSKSSLPGGDLAKPLMLALLALFASGALTRKSESGQSPRPKDAGASPQQGEPDLSLGGIVGGLGGLIERFQKGGQGAAIDSWVSSGPNASISSGQVSQVFGEDILNELQRRTGLSRQELLNQLAQVLPNMVDKLTPSGRLPTESELSRLSA